MSKHLKLSTGTFYICTAYSMSIIPQNCYKVLENNLCSMNVYVIESIYTHILKTWRSNEIQAEKHLIHFLKPSQQY